jgi:hypothetical protein
MIRFQKRLPGFFWRKCAVDLQMDLCRPMKNFSLVSSPWIPTSVTSSGTDWSARDDVADVIPAHLLLKNVCPGPSLSAIGW